MRRSLLLTAILAALVPATAARAAAPVATVAVDSCGVVTAKQQDSVTFSAEMEYQKGADTMSMRFELLSRTPGEVAFSRVPEADETVQRKASVKLYRYGPRTFIQPDLGSAIEYRARVTFRWVAADGTATTVRRQSSVCRLEPEANLTLGSLTTSPAGQPGMLRYAIPVRNDGRSDAGAFDVALRIGAESRPPVTVTGVAAGGSQTVEFVAPRCAAGDLVRIEVDPDGRIPESDERDNVQSFACPAAL